MNAPYALRDRDGRPISFEAWMTMQQEPSAKFVGYSIVGEHHEVRTEWSGLDYYGGIYRPPAEAPAPGVPTFTPSERTIFETRVYADGERVIRFGGDHAAPIRMLWSTEAQAERGHNLIVQRLAAWLHKRDGYRPEIADAADWRDAAEMAIRLHAASAAP